MTPATVPCVGNRRHALNSCSPAPWAGCSDTVHRKLACRVLSPPEAPGRRPRSASVDASQTPAPAGASVNFWSSTTAFASQLLSHFRAPAFAAASADAVLREASTKERELQNSQTPLDVTAFLSPVGVWELKRIRKLSALNVLTYYMHLVTPQRLQRAHGLTLVTTSRTCDIRPEELNNAAEEVVAEGDGMAVSFQEAKDMYQALKRDGGAATAGQSTGVTKSSNIVALSRELPYQVVSPSQATPPPSNSGGGGGPTWPVPPTLAGQGAAAAGLAQSLAQSSAQAPPPPQQPHQQPGGAGSGPLATPTAVPRMFRTPGEIVAAKLAEAAQAATAAATNPLASAAESLYAGLASLPIGTAIVGTNNRASNALVTPPPSLSQGSATFMAATSTSSVDSTAVPPSSASPTAGASVDGAAAPVGSNGARKATAASIAALASEQIRQQALGAASAPSTSSSSLTFSSSPSLTCPSEWFVVDDPATNTRIFVIQGSDTLDHWKLNLTFDPVTFEDASLGVRVHRGVYEAAAILYERFLPLVYEHLQSSHSPMVAFTGHSIGGSLATLLMLMYRYRGILPPHTIATVYTFGSPAVFCQSHNQSPTALVPYPSSSSNSWISPSLWSLGSGGSISSISSISSVEEPPAASTSAPESAAKGTAGCACGADLLLARMELPSNIVRNVIMTQDIVPRAFACDYSLVADILKSWGASFKEHCCLNRRGRKHLYYFVGRMCILQPDTWHSFVANDPYHPMLPPGPELFALTDANPQQQLVAAPVEAVEAVPAGAVAAAASRPAARSVTEAIWELMDCPHPLETLADPGAYLSSGSISRYHNPENYTRALARIMHLKRQAERRPEQRLPPAAADASVDAAAAAVAAEAEVEVEVEIEAAPAVAAIPWDSSDGLDLNLQRVAAALQTVDVHACR